MPRDQRLTTASPKPVSLGRRIAFILIGGGLGACFALAIIFFTVGAAQMVVLTTPRCAEFPRLTLSLPQAQAVSFPSSEFNRPTAAWFVPGDAPRKDAVVIAMPTLNTTAGDRATEIAVMVGGGYDVLAFDARACVGAVSPSLGILEARQAGDALAYLNSRPDIDPARIAVHGFSAGGAAALMAAAQFPQIAAVIAQGNYDNLGRELRDGAARFGLLQIPFLLGGEAAYRLATGVSVETLRPDQAIPDIVPRPVLLIYGTAEPSLDGARRMQALDGPAVRLWEVEGAGHGGYLETAPDEYQRQVIGFLDGVFG